MRHSEGEPLGWDLERDRRDEPYEILRRPPRTIGRPRVATGLSWGSGARREPHDHPNRLFASDATCFDRAPATPRGAIIEAHERARTDREPCGYVGGSDLHATGVAGGV